LVYLQYISAKIGESPHPAAQKFVTKKLECLR